jgi:large-conductance mechanosensitive channel
MGKHKYNPIEFVVTIELFTIGVLGSFVTWKLLNVCYENLYEPCIDYALENKDYDKYYINIGTNKLKVGYLIKEFIKWIVIIIILMIVYNWYNDKSLTNKVKSNI